MLDDRTVAHHREPVRDGERLLLVVGDQQRGRAGVAEDPPQVGREPDAELGIEGGERLVEQQQPRLGRQRAGQRDSLALSAGEGARHPVAVPAQADQVEQAATWSARRGARHAAEPQRIADVAGDGQVVEELAVLEHQREAALVGGHAGEVGAVPPDPAAGPSGSRPAIARSSDDFPLPDGPSTASTCPSSTRRSTRVDRGVVTEGDGDTLDVEHQITPTPGTRSRSTSKITSAVAAASTTEAAMAVP